MPASGWFTLFRGFCHDGAYTHDGGTVSLIFRTPEPGPPLPPLVYEARGRRDPFAPVQVVTEKTGLEVGTVKLVGIISGSKPLALAETPDGLGYILKQGDVLGNGRVTEVTANSVTFAISGRAAQRETSLTLRIGRD